MQQTFKIMQDLRDRGVSILMIEQNARSALHDPGIGQLFLGGAMEETAT